VTRRLAPLAALAGVLAALAAASATASSSHTLVLYAVATKATFVDHADDRARGQDKNPFNADIKALGATAKENEKGHGPYPGDEALLVFKLYARPNRTQPIGSAVYSCTYNLAKHALCRADFDLKGGSLFATGPVDFSASDFTIAVISGTGKYVGAFGQVSEGSLVKPLTKNMHRLDFDLG
jgi:hypothetical protein